MTDGRYVVSKPLSHEVVQPQLASNYTLPRQNNAHSPGMILCRVSLAVSGCVAITVTTSLGVVSR